jgi:predicted RNase H-like HicB family nuclease
MKQNVLRLTGLIRKERDQYSSLCLELDVASCGRTKEEAFKGLKTAVETYVTYLVQEGREDEIYRPVPQEAIREFLLGEVEERKFTTVYAVPLELSYAS